MALFLFLCSLVVFASFALMPVARRAGAPFLLLALVIGMLLGEDGPGGIQFSNFGLAFELGSIALAVILFAGGLEAERSVFRSAGAAATSLATFGVLITAGVTGLAATFILGLPWMQGLLLGGIGDTAADEWNMDRNTGFRAALEAAIAGEDTPAAKTMRARAAATGSTLEGYLGSLSSRLYTGRDLLETFDVPVLVLTGDQDTDNGSGPALAEIIPGARYEPLTGTHISAVGDPALPEAIIRFLNEGR